LGASLPIDDALTTCAPARAQCGTAASTSDAAAGGDVRNRRQQRFLGAADGLYRFFAVRLGSDNAAADDLMQQLWLHASRSDRDVPDAE
jgi:hypothetical protein